MAGSGREPLFPVPGALWARNNTQVWVDNEEMGKEVHRVLVSNGYRLEGASMLNVGIYRFTYFDPNGQNNGRAGGENMFVDLFVRLLDFSSLMFEVAYRFGDKPWRVFRDNGVGAWYGEHNAELPSLTCQGQYPHAEVVVRPTLFPVV